MKRFNQCSQRFPEKSNLSGIFLFFAFFLFGCLIVFPVPNHAEEAATAIITAQSSVETTISVESETSSIFKEFAGTGEIEITANFSVVANTNQVKMFVETTALYFNGDTFNPEVDPIPLDESSGVDINPAGTTILEGGNPASYIGDGDPVDSYPSRKTDAISFESISALSFNHSTGVTVTWNQDDPSKPSGQYFGKIKLKCFVESPE